MPKKKAALRSTGTGSCTKKSLQQATCARLASCHTAASKKLGLDFDFRTAVGPFIATALELAESDGKEGQLKLRLQLVLQAQRLVQSHAPICTDLAGNADSRYLHLLLYCFFQQVVWELGLNQHLRSMLQCYQQQPLDPSTSVQDWCACLGVYGLAICTSREQLLDEELPRECLPGMALSTERLAPLRCDPEVLTVFLHAIVAAGDDETNILLCRPFAESLYALNKASIQPNGHRTHLDKVLASDACMRALWSALASDSSEAFAHAVHLLTALLTHSGFWWGRGPPLRGCALESLLHKGGEAALVAALDRVTRAVQEQRAAPHYAALCARLQMWGPECDPRELATTPEVMGQDLLACLASAAEAQLALHCHEHACNPNSNLFRLLTLGNPGGGEFPVKEVEAMLHASLEDETVPAWPPQLLRAHLELFLQIIQSPFLDESTIRPRHHPLGLDYYPKTSYSLAVALASEMADAAPTLVGYLERSLKDYRHNPEGNARALSMGFKFLACMLTGPKAAQAQRHMPMSEILLCVVRFICLTEAELEYLQAYRPNVNNYMSMKCIMRQQVRAFNVLEEVLLLPGAEALYASLEASLRDFVTRAYKRLNAIEGFVSVRVAHAAAAQGPAQGVGQQAAGGSIGSADEAAHGRPPAAGLRMQPMGGVQQQQQQLHQVHQQQHKQHQQTQQGRQPPKTRGSGTSSTAQPVLQADQSQQFLGTSSNCAGSPDGTRLPTQEADQGWQQSQTPALGAKGTVPPKQQLPGAASTFGPNTLAQPVQQAGQDQQPPGTAGVSSTQSTGPPTQQVDQDQQPPGTAGASSTQSTGPPTQQVDQGQQPLGTAGASSPQSTGLPTQQPEVDQGQYRPGAHVIRTERTCEPAQPAGQGQQPSGKGGKRVHVCINCKREGCGMKKCSRCGARVCNRACFVEAWRNGHKLVCVAPCVPNKC